MREFPQDAPAVVARSFNYENGARQQPHSHERIQLMYSPTGIMRVMTEDGAWMLAPMRALWIPAGVTHEVKMVGSVSMRSAFIMPDAAPWLWKETCALDVNPLMRELILTLNGPPRKGPVQRLSSELLLNLLADTERQHRQLPLPFDRRLRKVCDAVLQAPGNDDTLEQWGERIGASARTLARRMKDETGMSFHHWRLQVRIDEGICRLLQGQSVVNVARALGYASASAFVYMFRNLTGVSPSRYVEQITAA
nr:helix-turn-helix transcriptional regulator [uncultured Achromobacter sp.]